MKKYLVLYLAPTAVVDEWMKKDTADKMVNNQRSE